MHQISLKDAFEGKDSRMISEKQRLLTFESWPFTTGPCVKEKMAKAGFYRCDERSDAVRCFCCFKELDQWSHNDEPWDEHIKHSKNCFFAQLQKEEQHLTVDEVKNVLIEREINRNAKLCENELNTVKSQPTNQLLKSLWD
ncbi:survivin-like protein [Dinothrombium tinctorium]|uniref:Survivin-like protein n=1 Tax=Dinothrombium tinctorium TaxID=1965070 RepID=A0A3S3Q2Z1_9ACAR|nr:survivin-like protein [Dinothrombium tinctorium]RWS12971.1 survivin-like protein [Dinothrombium tinctorium]